MKAGGLAFLTADKLSGGLLSAGLTNLVGGIAGGLTRALATAGLGRIFVQPVFVTNPGFGLPGNGPGGGPGGFDLRTLIPVIGGLIAFDTIGKEIGKFFKIGEFIPGTPAYNAAHPNGTPLVPGNARSSTEGGFFGPLTQATGNLDNTMSALGSDGLPLQSGSLERALYEASVRMQAAALNAQRLQMSSTIRISVTAPSTSYGVTSTSYYGGSPAPSYSH